MGMNNVCTAQKLIAEPVAEMGFESRTERLQQQDCNAWGGGLIQALGKGTAVPGKGETELGPQGALLSG